MKQHRKWVYGFILALFLCLGMMAVSVFWVDPLQQYGPPRFLSQKYYKLPKRYLTSGLIKQHNFDTIVVGTSMTENFRPSYIDKKLGGHSIKLSIAGASAFEEKNVISAAIATGKVHTVLFGLDHFSFMGDAEHLRHGDGTFPLYLYDDKINNDYKYLFNIDTIQYMVKILSDSGFQMGKPQLDRDRYCWWNDRFKFSHETAVAAWKTQRTTNLNGRSSKVLEEMKTSFTVNFFEIIQNNPDVDFIVFFPPYSILAWLDIREQQELEEFLKFKKFVCLQLSGKKNVDIYDFQDISKIILNLENYRDHTHYGSNINDFIIDSIGRGDYRLDLKNIDDRTENMRRLVDGQNLDTYL